MSNTFVADSDFINREARGVRGRFGVDVWEQWKALPRDKRVNFLTRYGVPLDRVDLVEVRILEVLAQEGI